MMPLRDVVTRRLALMTATKDVCSWCGGRSYPNVPQYHDVFGPNEAGNYTHETPQGTTLCVASAIWSRLKLEAQQRQEEQAQLAKSPKE